MEFIIVGLIVLVVVAFNVANLTAGNKEVNISIIESNNNAEKVRQGYVWDPDHEDYISPEQYARWYPNGFPKDDEDE